MFSIIYAAQAKRIMPPQPYSLRTVGKKKIKSDYYLGSFSAGKHDFLPHLLKLSFLLQHPSEDIFFHFSPPAQIFAPETVSHLVEIDSLSSFFPPVRARGLSRECAPPYPQRDRKRRLNGAVCRNHRIKRLVPCRCLDGHIKEPYEMSMALGARP